MRIRNIVPDEPHFVHLFGNAYAIASKTGRVVCSFTYKDGKVKLANPDHGMKYYGMLRKFSPQMAVSLDKAKQMGWG